METVDILIDAVGSEKARQVIARHLAADPSVDLRTARDMVNAPPILYRKNIDRSEANDVLEQLSRMGVRAHLRKADVEGSVQSMWDDYAAAAAPSPDATSSRRTHSASTPPVSFVAAQPARSDSNVKKRGAFALAGVVLGVLACCYVVFFRMGDDRRIGFAPTPASSDTTGRGPGPATDMHDTAAAVSAGDVSAAPETYVARGLASSAAASMGYTDSARLCSRTEQKIAFYRIAISFNKHNVSAWMGLIQAYTEAGMQEKARAAQKRMNELFPDSVARLEDEVARYGRVVAISSDARTHLRVEYMSRVSGKEKLVREAFSLVRSLQAEGAFARIVLLVHSSEGEKVLVPVDVGAFTGEYARFVATTDITYIP